MRKLTFHNIREICGGTLYTGSVGENRVARFNEETEATGVVIDSRRITEGGIFIATRGERVDGHDFIPEVMKKGALGVICEKKPENAEGLCLVVEDSLQALRQIARFYREQLTIPVVGITGSVGKTSTKELIASVLSQHFTTCRTEGNFNNEIGVPLTLLRIQDTDGCAVVEMGINHFGEMERLSAMAQPTMAVITNIGECHLEALGDRDGVLRAKSEIFQHMKEGSGAVLNGMDDKLRGVTEVCGRRSLFYGISDKADGDGLDAWVSDIVSKGTKGSSAVLHYRDGESFPIELALPGEHMLLNAAAAALVGRENGLTKEEIAAGIQAVKPVGGRSHVIESGSYTIIDDCYNANPTSVHAALKLLSDAAENGHRCAILGDMFELGEDSAALHAGTGRDAVECGIDHLICVGSLSANMYEAVKDSAIKAEYFATVEELIAALSGLFKPQDTILVKASHSMGLSRVVEELRKG